MNKAAKHKSNCATILMVGEGKATVVRLRTKLDKRKLERGK